MQEKSFLLDQWKSVHETMFGSNPGIPSAAEMHISKLEGGVINTVTCNAARLTSKLLAEAIEQAVNEKIVSGGGDIEIKPVTVLR